RASPFRFLLTRVAFGNRSAGAAHWRRDAVASSQSFALPVFAHASCLWQPLRRGGALAPGCSRIQSGLRSSG
ncbi:MAG: hypothetical protein ACRBBN_12085, partial [Methyloligellaceae bacterium]